jgi:hypothetical protein
MDTISQLTWTTSLLRCLREGHVNEGSEELRHQLEELSTALGEFLSRPPKQEPANSQDPRQHLKDVRAYHELNRWHLLSVVHLEASGRWLYYLEREAEPAPPGAVTATAVGSEQAPPEPVRRVEGDRSGEVATRLRAPDPSF